MTSIKKRITRIIMIVIIVVCLVLGITVVIASALSATNTLSKTMTELSEVAADRVRYELGKFKDIAFEAGCLVKLSSPSVEDPIKQATLDDKVETYGYTASAYINANGIATKNGSDMSGIPVVAQALAGETAVSSPLQQEDGSQVFLVAAPIWQDGKPHTKVVGAVTFTLDGEYLNDIVRSIVVGDTGNAYIIDNAGNIIAHKDSEVVKQKQNNIELAKTDKSYEALAAVEQRVLNGDNSTKSYNIGGVAMAGAFAPIKETNGWGIIITVEQSEYLKSAIIGAAACFVWIVVFVVVGFIVARRFAKSVSVPIAQCSERLELLANGDLHSDVPTTNSKDETGELLRDLKTLIDRLNDSISDTGYHLDKLANGDFHESVTREYHGDFKKLADSTTAIYDGLNSAFKRIDTASILVASNADQVAVGSQSLAQGATEQASSIEELSSSLNNISESVSETSKLTKHADELSVSVEREIENSNKQMNGMVAAMDDISNTSEQISRIIKTIEDIAFQTNILALNAAVEAARAGEAGKGFAVVADEVRNLASKSADAANNTTELIESSINAVQNGVKIADATFKSLSTVVEGSKSVTEIVRQIAKATEFETEAIFQTTQGIDQISSVVQVTSATAEESAAASQELSSQAAQLRALLEMIKLRETQE